MIGDLLDLEFLFQLSDKAERCPLQDPYRIRARYLGWKVASVLIDEKGELLKNNLQQILSALDEEPYLLMPHQDGDERIYHHLLTCLQALAEDGTIWKAIQRCTAPLANKTVEEVVRDTLWPEVFHRIQTPQVRRAALTAWLTLLRQGTGSCFATAPAILVHEQKPLMFLQDLEAILSASQLRRGAFSVPMSLSSGAGEWRKSFHDLSAQESPGMQAAMRSLGIKKIAEASTPEEAFSSTLLQQLGLTREDLSRPRQPVVVREIVEMRLSAKAKKIQEWEKAIDLARRSFCSLADCALLRSWEYTIASFCDVKVEFGKWNLFVSLGLHPDCPDGIGKYLLERIQEKLDQSNRTLVQINREHQQAIHNIRALESLLKRTENPERHRQLQGEMMAAVTAANGLVQMLDEAAVVGEWLSKLFPTFIQHTIERLQLAFQEIFDPALTRGEQYEDSPAGFRLVYKQGRTAAASWERIENEGQFVDAIYRFFESLEREFVVEARLKDSFTELMTALLQFIRSDLFLEKSIRRAQENHGRRGLPWAYESGGTMQTLVQSYFQLPALPKEFSRAIRSEEELLMFLKAAREVLQGPGPWLMHSPTHAFLLNLPPQNPEEEQFFPEKPLMEDQIEFLAARFSKRFPEELRPLFYAGFRQRPTQNIRERFLLGLQVMKETRSEIVDGFLYESLPLFSSLEAKNALQRLMNDLQVSHVHPKEIHSPILTLRELIETMKEALLASGIGPFSAIDWEMQIAKWIRREGIAFPMPWIFGDTNWSDWSFGFVEKRLWRMNRTGLRGYPMHEWDSIIREGGVWTILIEDLLG